MGRASRRRAEQRQQPLERSAGAAVGRSWDGAWGVSGAVGGASGALPRRVERSALRRSPFHRPPPGAPVHLQRLGELRTARAEVDAAMVREVQMLLALGTDWGSIGRALGVSRQAARQRYGPAHP